MSRWIGPLPAALIIVAASLLGVSIGLALGAIWLPSLTELCLGGLVAGTAVLS